MSRTARITLVGGPTVLLEVGGLRLVTDPTFDAPGSYPSSGGAVTLTKRTGPALAADAVGAVDAVLLSHDQHADNLDPAGRAFLRGARRVLTTREAAGRLPGAEGLAPWERRLLAAGPAALLVTATPARHGPPGIEPLSGEVTGFVVSEPEGRDLVYVTGDTVFYEGVAEVARRFRPAVVLMFTGAARTRGPFHLTMSVNDALETARAFPGAALVAVHNEGWAHFTESASDLERSFAALGQQARLVPLARGGTAELPLPPREA
ncbi:beta-lactamase fold-like Zn-dependent hydrolase [Anaeromyxobacter sp. K]|uniref:MBL fold metallo-hydrolase n=1 Tax=Anaeromyxobacter sp. (strain K) TaxID=447217 RepID=UPI00015F9A3B|nr:MBL fold metallo-hydrolase [Anaeromyxobacter sp. K]ACG72860.1 beta-lactamase fold-like Zn-dependent hydrolase [Anaeromyxobacter sp. K]